MHFKLFFIRNKIVCLIKAIIIVICIGWILSPASAQKIQPTWESMAGNYKVPGWFQDGKIGIWIHWGISSAVDENRPPDGSWYGSRMYGSGKTASEADARDNMSDVLSAWHIERYGPLSDYGYEKLIPLFKAENWDPDAMVTFFRDCGARFIMPVACHHDNFDMYDSFFPWNSVKTGPHRDILGEWKDAAYKQGLKFGVSTHLYWSPRYYAEARQYQKPGTPEWEFFNMDYDPENYASQDSWNEHWYARCWDIIEKYDPDMFNNDAPYPDEKRGKSLGVKLFSDYLNKNIEENGGVQTAVLSFKNGNMNKAAFTYNLERGMFGDIQEYPWMWATDISGKWFYRKDNRMLMSFPLLIGNAVDVISKNGIVMMNVAPKGDGTLPEAQAEILSGFGEWMKINGEGIYGTRPWRVYGEGPLEIITKRSGENLKPFSQEDIRFTCRPGSGPAAKGDTLFAFVLAPPVRDITIKTLKAGGILDKKIKDISMLGSSERILWKRTEEGLIIKLPKLIPDQPVIGFKIICK